MLTLQTRIWIALAMLVLAIVGAIVLEILAPESDLTSVLFGWAGATFVGLLDMVQAHRRSIRPAEPERQLGREETNPRLPIPPVPRESTGKHRLQGKLDGSAFEELDENDIDTERPPAPVGPLDDDHDTDPQTPRAIKRGRQ